MCAKRAKSRLSRTHTFLGRFFGPQPYRTYMAKPMAVATLKIHLLSWRTQSPALCKVIDASMNCWHTWHLSLAARLIFGLVIRGHFLGLSRWMSPGQIQLCWKVSGPPEKQLPGDWPQPLALISAQSGINQGTLCTRCPENAFGARYSVFGIRFSIHSQFSGQQQCTNFRMGVPNSESPRKTFHLTVRRGFRFGFGCGFRRCN